MRPHEIFLFLYFQESDKTHFKRLLSKIFKANILIESIFNDWLIWNETNWYKFKDLKKNTDFAWKRRIYCNRKYFQISSIAVALQKFLQYVAHQMHQMIVPYSACWAHLAL